MPDLPTLTGGISAWVVLGLKVLATVGFMAAADTLILYAS